MSTLLTCTSSTRPGSPAAGDTLFETDTNKVIVYSGTAWKEYQDNGRLYNDSDITALSPHLWLDAENGDFYDDELKSNSVSDHGKRVGTWADRSGNGFDFTQATSTFRPLLIKNFGRLNRTFLLYESNKLGFTGTASSQIAGAGSTMFFALQYGAVNGDYIFRSSDFTTRIRATLTSGTNLRFHAQNYAGTGNSSTYLLTDNNDTLTHKTGILAFRFGSSLAEAFVNGTTQADTETTIGTGNLLTNGVTYEMFYNDVADENPNMLGDFMLFDSALSDSDMNTVFSYFSKKYGVAVSTL